MKISEGDIKKLERLQANENGGRGVSCVRDIIAFLRMGNFIPYF